MLPHAKLFSSREIEYFDSTFCMRTHTIFHPFSILIEKQAQQPHARSQSFVMQISITVDFMQFFSLSFLWPRQRDYAWKLWHEVLPLDSYALFHLMFGPQTRARMCARTRTLFCFYIYWSVSMQLLDYLSVCLLLRCVYDASNAPGFNVRYSVEFVLVLFG